MHIVEINKKSNLRSELNRWWTARLKDNSSHEIDSPLILFMAMLDGAPVGFAALSEADRVSETEHEAVLTKVYVEKAFRGRNIATMLISRSIAKAREMGFEHVMFRCPAKIASKYTEVGWEVVGQGEANTTIRYRTRPRLGYAGASSCNRPKG